MLSWSIIVGFSFLLAISIFVVFRLKKTLDSKIILLNNLEQQKRILEQQNIESSTRLSLLDSQHKEHLRQINEHFEMRINEINRHHQAEIATINEQFSLQIQNSQSSKQELKDAFKALSADILRQNTQSFNQSQLLSLQPLKEHIEQFQKQLSLAHTQNIQQNSTLQANIEQLYKLNTQLAQEANNLTNALKGENKIQGNWGEIILQKVLESSGLQEGREYELQTSLYDESNNLFRPDAIVNLPKNRCVIIDAKTSLISYEKLCNAKEDSQKLLAQKELITSLQTHFNALSAKNYQHILKNDTKLDFVLMFVPIEGAFLEALKCDSSLYERAYQKGVILVSPTTIMVVLRVISNMWQVEHRNANVDKIFSELDVLFKRVEKFESSLEQMGQGIQKLSKTYDEVMTKYSGRQGIENKKLQIQNLLKGIEAPNQNLLKDIESNSFNLQDSTQNLLDSN